MSDFATTWTVTCQAPLGVGFSRQEYWSGWAFPSPGNLLDQESNLHLLRWQAGSLLDKPPKKPLLLLLLVVHKLRRKPTETKRNTNNA